MKREIKFRAWDTKTMHYWKMGDSEHPTELFWCFGADKMPHMQFIGIKDKKGKEIYEGDLLKDEKNQVGQVLWHGNSWLVEWEERDWDGQRTVERFYDDCFRSGEVIGNVYENPELIK